MPLNLPPQVVKRGLRLAIALALVTAVVAVFRMQILDVVVPLYLREIVWLGDDFRIASMSLQRITADTYIGVSAGLARPVVGAGKILYPDQGIETAAYTLAGYTLQTIIIFGGVLLAWPLRCWRDGLLRLVIGLPVLLFTLLVDVPLVLLAGMWKGVLKDLGDTRFSPLLAWENFLSYGGRLGLALLASVVCVLLANYVAGRLGPHPAPAVH